MKKYDVIIVGAGPAGIFTAYKLATHSNKKVLLVDKGSSILRRSCPILEKKITKCPPASRRKDFAGCLPACSIINGFGGAGAFSDGKFNITNEFGGWLNQYLSDEQVTKLIREVDTINLEHGATLSITDPNTPEVREIEKRGFSAGLKLLRSQVRHLGTEENLKILESISNFLEDKIDMLFATMIEDIIVEDEKVIGIKTKKEEIYGDHVVLTIGRDGSNWLKETLGKVGVQSTLNQVDIGVRLETTDFVMSEVNKHLYEGKFIFNTSVGTQVRTFCSNPSGHVVIENHSGTMLANGHAYKDKKLASTNTNFALLVSHTFTEPFKNPNEFAHTIGRLANQISDGSILVQSYGDIKKGRRSTEKRLAKSFIRPTLKEAVAGDITLALPYITMKSIIEMIEALDVVTPGLASEHTLLYAVETKFYSSRFEVNSEFETHVKNLYLGGDGAGFTRGLAQAGANGIAIADSIIAKK